MQNFNVIEFELLGENKAAWDVYWSCGNTHAVLTIDWINPGACCNGWPRKTAAQCQEKCDRNERPLAV